MTNDTTNHEAVTVPDDDEADAQQLIDKQAERWAKRAAKGAFVPYFIQLTFNSPEAIENGTHEPTLEWDDIAAVRLHVLPEQWHGFTIDLSPAHLDFLHKFLNATRPLWKA